MSGLGDGTNERWYGDVGVMKRGPFKVSDTGVGPLITEHGHLVIYTIDSAQAGQSTYCLHLVALLFLLVADR